MIVHVFFCCCFFVSLVFLCFVQFDHGCDAICTAMFCLVSAAALQYEPWMNTVSITVAMLAFYLGQWEEYHTGMLVLGYVNVTEALVSIEIVMLLAAYFGPGTLYSSGFSHLIFYISTFSALVSAAQYLGRTLLNTRNNRHGAKNAIQLLAPIATLLSAGFWWAQYSKIDIAAHYEYAFANIIGLTGSALVGRLVLARMMKSTVSAWQWSLLPMLLVAANDTLLDTPLVPRRESVYALVLWSAVSYFHFAMYVITTLCETLDINCLTIKAKATPSDGGAASPSRRRARSPARVSAAAAAAAPVKSTVSDGSSKARTRSPARRSPAPVGRSPAARSRSITPTRALSARTRELPARLQDGNFDNTF
jgi:hypothetical protein